MVSSPRDGSQTAREARPRRPKLAAAGAATLAPQGMATQSFVKLAERTTEVLISADNTAVEDVRRTLLQVRKQYDVVHAEAELKETKLRHVREQISAADRLHCQKSEEISHLEEKKKAFEQQYEETLQRIMDTQTSRKVYEHMLARIQKEQAILKEKMHLMEDHLARKRRDVHRRVADSDRANAERVQCARALEGLSEDAEAERQTCGTARVALEGEMERRREANRRKAQFEGWRHEVALQAANEAFNASAGRLRKLYAIEKFCGNALQKITFEQVERSQNTEDGFQKIREVTGLTDVMDIVHKFLNRDVEQDQLKGSVKDAEVRLEALRQDLEAFKRDTEGIAFDHPGGSDGSIFKDIEHEEQALNEAMQEHETSRARLQRTTLQTEHMKRWAVRIGQLLTQVDEPVRVEQPSDLGGFFKRLEGTVERFVEKVAQQISEGKVTHKALVQGVTREHNNQTRTLNDTEFLRNNCRVSATADGPPRSLSKQGNAEDDPITSFTDDRERCRKEATDLVHKAHQEHQKRSRPKG